MYKVLHKDMIENENTAYIAKTRRRFPPTVSLHKIVNDILYNPKTGVQWEHHPVRSLFEKVLLG